jgi:hypothetical protein
MKKLIITESELEQFVKNFLTEEDLGEDKGKSYREKMRKKVGESNQSGNDSFSNLIDHFITIRYQEIISEIKTAIESGDIDSLEMIYDEKIFNLTKNLHKVPKSSKIVTKFNQLEDVLVDYIELYKEHRKIKEELDRTLENLNDLL